MSNYEVVNTISTIILRLCRASHPKCSSSLQGDPVAGDQAAFFRDWLVLWVLCLLLQRVGYLGVEWKLYILIPLQMCHC